ncbi:MAG: hypothetical protein F6K62_00515 [Sphaerospermopsis sp. SIO1G2]|nr:hypothetical protein [Sphaerospermopsis sp. SIO1G1]NET69578.1 hypothetical protein [Sphaerospermopsis sp. SIO1G2]
MPKSIQAQTFLPNLYQSPNQQTSPQIQTQQTQIIDFDTNNPIYQTNPNTQINQSRQVFDKYIVYVNSGDREVLQRIQQIENTAYIREINGVRIIQSGVFTRPDNAQRRVRELESSGILNVGILGSASGQLVNYSPQTISNSSNTNFNNSFNNSSNNNFNNNSNNNFNNNFNNNSMNTSPNVINNLTANPTFRQPQPNYYYVVIPINRDNLDFLQQEIQQKIGSNANVYTRYQPRGTHIAVGAFQQRSDAEQWNDYLKSLGYGNARVYYGQ